MKRIKFNCLCELSEIMDSYVQDTCSDDEYPIISAYAPYEIAKLLVEMLVMQGNPIGCIMQLEEREVSGYNKEYHVSLTENGVACEKTFEEGQYLNSGGDISFVYEDCGSKLLKHIESDTVFEFGIVDDCDECEDKLDAEDDCSKHDLDKYDSCEELNRKMQKSINYSKDEDGNLHGFSVNKSDGNSYYAYSFYSTDKLTNRDIQSLLQEAGF